MFTYAKFLQKYNISCLDFKRPIHRFWITLKTILHSLRGAPRERNQIYDKLFFQKFVWSISLITVNQNFICR